MFRWIIPLAVVLLFSTNTYAGDHGFETTSEGIAEALTRPGPEEPARTRGWSPIHTRETRAIRVVRKDKGKTVEKIVSVSEGEASQSVNLKIEFDTNSYAIRPGSFKLLNELGEALTSDKIKDKTILVKGHTDADGSDAYNLKLSLNRAMSVQNYLVGNFDITPSRIQVMGYGEALPLVPNTSATNKQLNRRVEIQALQ